MRILISAILLPAFFCVQSFAALLDPVATPPGVAPPPAGFGYVEGAPGWLVTQAFYPGGTMDAFNPGIFAPTSPVSNALVARGMAGPAPTSSATFAGVPVLDYGGGGNFGVNNPFPSGGGNDFSVRGQAFIEIVTPGVYGFVQVADDTTWFEIQTAADGLLTGDNIDCCDNVTTNLNFTEAGIFAIDFVFGEAGGGEYFDFGINGPGIGGNVLLGDTANGSPRIFQLDLVEVAVPEPASIAIWSILGICLAGYGYRRRRRNS